MANPVYPNHLANYVGGIDFRRIDNEAKFLMGTKEKDQWGQVYCYVKVATDLSIADADADTLAVTFTYVLDAGTGGLITDTVDGDGSLNGAITSITASTVAGVAGASIDGVVERRVSGTGVQIDGTPTARYIWVKVKGIANRLLKPAALDAGQYADRITDGSGVMVEETAAGASLGNRFGRCIAEHDSGVAGDFLFDVEF